MSDTVLAAIVSGIVAVAVGLITARNSRRGQEAAAEAAVKNQTVSSRTEIEKEAFERAKAFYTGVIDRQDLMITARDQRIAVLEERDREREHQVEVLENEVDDLKAGREVDHAEIGRLKAALAGATELLEQRFNDDRPDLD